MVSKKIFKQRYLNYFCRFNNRKKILKKLIHSKKDFTLAIDRSKVLEGTMKVKVENNFLQTVGRNKDTKPSGNFIGISKIRKKKLKYSKKNLIKYINFYQKNTILRFLTI